MNWYKIKSVLIAMFLVIDIFLVIWNVTLRHEGQVVDFATIENTKELLESRGIKLADNLLEEEIPDIKRVVVRNAISDEAEFIGKILGKNYIKEDNVFYNENCSVKIDGNSFEIKEEVEIKNSEDAEKWLRDKGLDLSSTVKAEYRGEYVFRTMYKGLEVFGSRVSVKFEENKAKAYGNLFYVVENSETKTDVRHATAVLPRLIQEGVSDCFVSSVTAGYMVVADNSKFTEANANPAYRILLSDGREIFYNASK